MPSRTALALALVALAGAAGCRVPDGADAAPGAEPGSPASFGAGGAGGAGGEGVTELELQALVMQLADDHDAALGETVCLVLRLGEPDPTARWLSLSFLRDGMGASLDIAAGPNPGVALLDLLVLGSLQTWAFAEPWIPAGIPVETGSAAVERLRRAAAHVERRGPRAVGRAGGHLARAGGRQDRGAPGPGRGLVLADADAAGRGLAGALFVRGLALLRRLPRA